MNEPHTPHTAASAVTKAAVVWGGVLVSWELADWAAAAGLIASSLAAIYTLLLIWVTFRDRILRDKR